MKHFTSHDLMILCHTLWCVYGMLGFWTVDLRSHITSTSSYVLMFYGQNKSIMKIIVNHSPVMCYITS